MGQPIAARCGAGARSGAGARAGGGEGEGTGGEGICWVLRCVGCARMRYSYCVVVLTANYMLAPWLPAPDCDWRRPRTHRRSRQGVGLAGGVLAFMATTDGVPLKVKRPQLHKQHTD